MISIFCYSIIKKGTRIDYIRPRSLDDEFPVTFGARGGEGGGGKNKNKNG